MRVWYRILPKTVQYYEKSIEKADFECSGSFLAIFHPVFAYKVGKHKGELRIL